MLLGAALNELAETFSKQGDDKFRATAKAKFNLAYLEVGKSWDWPNLERYGSIVSIPNDTSGTVGFTTGQQTVTGNGTSFDASYQGRFFRFTGGENQYQIMNVSGQILTLDQPIIESSGSTFEIFKKFYPLPTEVRKITEWRQSVQTTQVTLNRGLRNAASAWNNPMQPLPFSIFGTDQFSSIYSDGTLLAVKNSNILTGVSTAWLANVRPGNIINYGSQDYRVARVETDTKIVMLNFSVSDYQGTYTVNADEALTAEMINDASATTKKVVPFSYIKSVYDLVNEDYDRTELSREADISVLEFANAYCKESTGGTPGEVSFLLSKAQARLERAQALSHIDKPAARQFAPVIVKANGR